MATGPVVFVKARRPEPTSTCVHCVVARLAKRLSRHWSRPVVLHGSCLRTPWVAMEAWQVHQLVRSVLQELAYQSAADTPIQVRVIDDGHPEIEIVATTWTHGRMRVRSLHVARHVNGSLERGFEETVL